jgi:DNA-binding winged helix-turn-helix (wHTH) protein
VKFRLGDVTLDPDTRQLLRGGAEIHLSPKAFDLLRMLVHHRPRVLSKTELHDQLWPQTFVSDANLASLVAEVRQALGDAARQPRFIRTAQRFGYGFCGEAIEVCESALSAESAPFCWLVIDRRRVPLQQGANVLGRDGDAVEMPSPTVSRRHARIVISGAEALLEDLESKNGTFVGGKRISKAVRLRDGDEIRTGSVTFRFRMTSPRGATATWSNRERKPTSSGRQSGRPVQNDRDSR